MNQEIIGNTVVITPSEGYTLAFRGDSSDMTYAEISRNKNRALDDIIEVKLTNLPTYVPNYEKSLTQETNLDEIKKYIILQTKNLLEEFLDDNPILFEGRYYNVSSNAQGHLASVIKAAESAQELGIPYTPMWNAVGYQREYYSLKTLKTLFIEIQKYVLQFVVQQQEMELQILSFKNKEELLNFNIIYNKED